MSQYVQTKFDSKSFNPVAFGKYVESLPSARRNELIKSKVLRGNAQIREALGNSTGTAFASIPMAGRIGGEAQNYDGLTDILADNLTTFEQGVVVIGKGKAWKEFDFSADITGGNDFMDEVAAQVAEYWDEVDQRTILSILKGIFSMTGAKNLEFINAHTMDITALQGEDKEGNPHNMAGATTLNTAIQKAGGHNKNKYTLAIMHSAVATSLENMNLLSYLKYTDTQGISRDLRLATWNGRLVLVDDDMPVEVVPETASGKGDGFTRYTTYIFGDGAFSFENIGAKVPYEMFRDPKTNGGQDLLYSRQRKVFAPYGISYTRKTQASLSPTGAELEKGENWEIVNNGATGNAKEYIDQGLIPMARIISRG